MCGCVGVGVGVHGCVGVWVCGCLWVCVGVCGCGGVREGGEAVRVRGEVGESGCVMDEVRPRTLSGCGANTPSPI